MAITITMTDPASDHALVRLMTWLSPGFPVGAFAFSHGVEAAIVDGVLHDRDSVRQWISTLIGQGSGWNDLVLLAAAWRAGNSGDGAALDEAASLCIALGGSLERRAETAALGAAFIEAARPWADMPDALPYPVAVGAVAARCGVGIEPTLAAYAHAFAANLTTAATRLIPLGQSDMVHIAHRLELPCLAAARRAATSGLDGLGSAAFLSDIAAMRHETQKTRVFRS